MTYALLELEFKNVAVVGVEYLMHTSVNNYVSAPTDIRTCLVVNRGDESAEERMRGVCTFHELTTLPMLPLYPTRFGSVMYPVNLVNGDILHIESPNKWRKLFNAPVQFDCVVTDASNPAEVVISPTSSMIMQGFTSMPSFARKLTFKVNGNFTEYTDGLVNRDYTGLSGSLFLAGSHADTWLDLVDAQNKFEAVPGEAQTLVDAMNEDRWTGEYNRRFE